MNTDDHITQLEEDLGYTFQNKQLLQKALTHRSYRYENSHIQQDNQRLEFLGDAVLGLVAAEYLFEEFTTVQEGKLTKLRSSVANSQSLSIIARKLDLGNKLLLGNGEQKSGGNDRDSNLADSLEAVIGAVYLDGGLPPVDALFRQHFLSLLDKALEQPEINNPKGCLQEYAQKHLQSSPEYVCIDESGPAHDRSFTYRVIVNDEPAGEGTASSKQQAQIAAAMQAIRKLDIPPPA